MRSIRWQSTGNNIVLTAKLQYSYRLMGAKSITNEQAWLATGLSSSLRVKYMFDPVETNRTVSITRF